MAPIWNHFMIIIFVFDTKSKHNQLTNKREYLGL